MSNQAKLSNINSSDSIKIIKTVVDFSVQSKAIGVYSLDAYLPKYHDIVNVDVRVDTPLTSGGSATVSIGVDDIASEPDNLLNDEAVASFSSNALVAGVPRLGTAATKVAVGTSDARLAYEIKTADLTAGKMTIITTLLPTA